MYGEDNQAWRQFHGTELGGLLSTIYGGQRKQIRYPTPKRNPFDPSAVKFRPVNSTLQASDPTKTTRRSIEVAVPRNFGKTESKENLLAVNAIPSRRSEDVIRAELEEINMRQRNYRPAYVQPRGDLEKERLAQICMYKGGKGLPVVLPVGETPMEMAAKRSMQQKNDAFLLQRRIARGDQRAIETAGKSQSQSSPRQRMSTEDKLADQIRREIEERSDHLEQMRAIGISAREDARLQSDISRRIEEMRGLGYA